MQARELVIILRNLTSSSGTLSQNKAKEGRTNKMQKHDSRKYISLCVVSFHREYGLFVRNINLALGIRVGLISFNATS